MTNCVKDEYVEEDKRTKLKACINLTKSRLSQDKSFYEEIRKLSGSENSQPKEANERMLNMCLLNCYNSITLIQAADVSICCLTIIRSLERIQLTLSQVSEKS